MIELSDYIQWAVPTMFVFGMSVGCCLGIVIGLVLSYALKKDD